MPTPSLDTLPKGHELPPFAFELTSEWVREYVGAAIVTAFALAYVTRQLRTWRAWTKDD